MPHYLETDRLFLRELVPDDAPFIRELMNAPEWLQHIGDRKVYTDMQARAYIVEVLMPAYNAPEGCGFLLVCGRHNGTPMGICGVIKRTMLAYPDIGFALLSAYTGQGYAFESAQAVKNYAQKALHIKTLCAIISPDNLASMCLTEKLGFRFSNRITVKTHELDEELCLYVCHLEGIVLPEAQL